LALKQHKDDGVRYDQQVENSKEYVLPFIEKTKPVKAGMKVLEIGCGEGGVLAPFIELGCICIGVDLDEPRIALANNFFAKEVSEGKVQFLYKNVYDDDFLQQYRNAFDLIILKDTIEHIPEQEKFIPYLKNLLAERGQVFFGFPPWYMPFGGHQQVCQSKIASKLPYYHILPRGIYKSLLKMMGEDDRTITALMEVYDTRITIERFEKIVNKSGFNVKNKQHYLFNPIYRYKFGVQPRKQWGPITMIPFFRNFVTTCVYYTVGL
jgi:SAM-dependent methyltransferase